MGFSDDVRDFSAVCGLLLRVGTSCCNTRGAQKARARLMSFLLDLKIILKTSAVIAGQLLESQQIAQRNRSAANDTQLAGIPTSVPATAAQTVTNQPATTAFKEMV